jgi:hypothetical protein
MEVDQKSILPPPDLTALKSYIRFSSILDKKISHTDFHMCLVRNLVAHAGNQPSPQKSLGRPNASTKVGRLDSSGNKQ